MVDILGLNGDVSKPPFGTFGRVSVRLLDGSGELATAVLFGQEVAQRLSGKRQCLRRLLLDRHYMSTA
jgi:hypothetical protein